MVFPVPPEKHDLQLDRTTHIDLNVDESSDIEFSLSLEFADDNWEDYGIRYSYNVKSNNQKMQEEGGIIDGDSLDIRSSRPPNGGSVLVADINEEAGSALADELSNGGVGAAIFRATDVTDGLASCLDAALFGKH